MSLNKSVRNTILIQRVEGGYLVSVTSELGGMTKLRENIFTSYRALIDHIRPFLTDDTTGERIHPVKQEAE